MSAQGSRQSGPCCMFVGIRPCPSFASPSPGTIHWSIAMVHCIELHLVTHVTFDGKSPSNEIERTTAKIREAPS